jgi:flagellin-like hook-associated protein FlgL
MIGPMSSSLSLAQRTASTARATMDTMARQIATGQRVSSVKDDGAAWTRAAAMRADQVTWDVRGMALSRLQAAMEVTSEANELTRAAHERLAELVLAARSSTAGSPTRQRIQAEWNQTTEWTRTLSANPVIDNGTGYVSPLGFQPLTGDSFFGPTYFAAHFNLAAWDTWMTLANPVALRGFAVDNASDAQLDQAAQTIELNLRQSSQRADHWSLSIGADMALAEKLQTTITSNRNRLDGFVAALTDADLGKASTAHADAETRQQLALSTVRTAISAYGNFAGGLLGNVQRTQRGLLA